MRIERGRSVAGKVDVFDRRGSFERDGTACLDLQGGDERSGRSLLVEFEATSAGDSNTVGGDLGGAGEQRPIEGEREVRCQVAAVGCVGEHDDVGVDALLGELADDRCERGGPAGGLDRAELDEQCGGRQPVEFDVAGSAARDESVSVAFADRLGGTSGEHPVTYRDQRNHSPSVRSCSSLCVITGVRRRSRIHRMISIIAVIPRAVPKASQNAMAWSSSKA